jgi:hypothetical protein
MLRTLFIASLLSASVLSPAFAQPAPAAAASSGYTTADTTIGTLLDDPAAKAAIDGVMPGFSTNPQIEMARSMTFAQIQSYAPDQFSQATLDKLDAAFAKLPKK